ncbi:Involucrin repeat protein [Rutstroemia sp. NJR-2017a WRK4]|nr:Involucrin repeat protein [Rutstroemia sp. NJR-2017a WRK4]
MSGHEKKHSVSTSTSRISHRNHHPPSSSSEKHNPPTSAPSSTSNPASSSSTTITPPPRVRLSHANPTTTTTTESHPPSRSSTPSISPPPPQPPPSASISAPPRPISPLSDASSDNEDLDASTRIQNLKTNLLHTRETLHLLQTAHSTLHNSYLSTDTSLRLLRSTHAACPTQGDIQSRISSLMLDRDAFREAYNEAMGEIREKDEEIMGLRGQVRGLKEWVSSSGRGGVGGEQVTDEVVGEKMQWVGNALQNWVIVNFRRAKMDVSKASSELREQLESLVPTYESLAAASRVNFIQSLVSSLLVETIFQPYFVGLPEQQAEELRKTEKTLGSYGSEESMNQWRSTTLSILLKEAPQKLHSETNAVIESLIAQLNSILDPICDIPRSEARDQSLRAIVTSSIELSRLLRVQKAVFSIMLPSIEAHQRVLFDEVTMEDIGGEDEESLQEREIACVTFPGIIKAGDENGERNHLRNVVAKIKVLCAPD